MSAQITQFVKAILPAPLYAPVRCYLLRLHIWLRVMKSVAGVNAQDKLWLLVSFIASPFTAAVALGRWRDPVLLQDISVEVEHIGRFCLRAHTDDLWHVVPFREPAVLLCIRQMLRPGDCFVDVGANIGVYTIAAAAAVWPSGSVIGVEMMRETAEILRQHVRLNGASCVRVVEGALTSRDGELVRASMPAGSWGQASIAGSNGTETFDVQTTTLNSVLRDVPSIHLMKMDIEGAELEALKGADEVLDGVEAIIFEALGSAPGEVIGELLVGRGFRVARLDGSNNLATRDHGGLR